MVMEVGNDSRGIDTILLLWRIAEITMNNTIEN